MLKFKLMLTLRLTYVKGFGRQPAAASPGHVGECGSPPTVSSVVYSQTVLRNIVSIEATTVAKSITIAGLQFTLDNRRWCHRREFPFLPSSDESQFSIDSESRTPSAAQIAAITEFLRKEESICKAMLETILRYVQVSRNTDPSWFAGVPTVNSAESLGRIIELQDIGAMEIERDGEALLGVYFSCEWDPEHGLGVAVHQGLVVDIGNADVSFEPNGIYVPDGVLDAAQTAAWEKLFGEYYREHQWREQCQKKAIEDERLIHLQRAIDDPKTSSALRELTQLLIVNPGLALQFTLEVKPTISLSDFRLTAQSIKALKAAAGNIMALDPQIRNEMMQGMPTQESQRPSMVEVFCWLGGEFAMWHHTERVGSSRLVAGPWPRVLVALANQWPGGKPQFQSVTILNKPENSHDLCPVTDTPVRTAMIAVISELFQTAS